jgi:dihydrofolate reductase
MDDSQNINLSEDEEFFEGLINTYHIIMGERTYDEIVSETRKSHFFLLDPSEDPSEEELYDLISFFEEYEEYEKCANLMEIIDGIK